MKRILQATVVVILIASAKLQASSDLMKAVRTNNQGAVEAAIKAGANVNETLDDGWTPLIEAVFRGNTNIVKYLLEHGARTDDKASRHWTALMEAVVKGNLDIVNALIKAGADVNARTYNDRVGYITALQLANSRKPQIVNVLKAHGAK